MPDDFQAKPPPVPPSPPPSYGDRYTEVSFRKPERPRSPWRAWIVLPGVGIFALLAVGLVWRMKVSPPGITVRAPLSATPAFVPAAPAPRNPDPQARSNLEGTWIATAVTIDGDKAGDEDLGKVKLTIGQDAGRLIFSLGLPGDEWTGRVVTTKEQPKRIYFILNGSGRAGLHEVQGNTLRICVNAVSQIEPPTDFAAPKDSRRILLELKRLAERDSVGP